MEDFNCLVCSDEVLYLPNNADYHSHQSQHQKTIWELLQLNSSEFCDGIGNGQEGPFFCYSCSKKMEQVDETLKKLTILQAKLNTFREEVESKIIATNEQKATELRCRKSGRKNPLNSNKPLRQSDKLREQVVSVLVLYAKSSGLNPIPVSIDTVKQEIFNSIEESQPLSPPAFSYSDSPRYDYYNDDRPASALLSPFPDEFSLFSANTTQDIHIQNHATKEGRWSKKQQRDTDQLFVRLYRINEKYPQLSRKLTVTLVNGVPASTPIAPVELLSHNEESEHVPEDPWNAHDYIFPTNCKIKGCKSTVVFNKPSLKRHIRDVHMKPKKNDPLDKLTYPSQCPTKDCQVETLYPDKIRLRRHIRVAHELKCAEIELPFAIEDVYQRFPTKCLEPGCKSEVEFKDKRRIKMHLIWVHYNPRRQPRPWDDCFYPTKCPMPDCKSIKLFEDREQLRRHIHLQHFKKTEPTFINPLDSYQYPTTCQVIGCKSVLEFSSKDKLCRHIRDCHKIKLKDYPAVIASTGSSTTETTTPKNLNPKPESRICEVCGVILANNKQSLKSHMRIHTGDLFTCTDCGSKFVTNYNLKLHRDIHHTITPKIYKCPHQNCSKIFYRPRSLQVHLWRHNNTKRHVCTICNESFMFKNNLTDHKHHKHYKELGLEPFQCKLCNRIYSCRSNLDTHLKTHSGSTRFNCTICNYSTDRPTDFKEHEATVHSNEAKFKCDICGKSFKLKRRLIEHVKYHQDNWPFQCQLCGRRCADGKTLRVHLRNKHTKEELEGLKGKEDEEGELDVIDSAAEEDAQSEPGAFEMEHEEIADQACYREELLLQPSSALDFQGEEQAEEGVQAQAQASNVKDLMLPVPVPVIAAAEENAVITDLEQGAFLLL